MDTNGAEAGASVVRVFAGGREKVFAPIRACHKPRTRDGPCLFSVVLIDSGRFDQ